MDRLERLRDFRKKVGISQYDMARKLNISLSFFEKVENGHVKPSRGFMEKLKKEFPTVDINDVFFSEGLMSKCDASIEGSGLDG